MTVCVALIQARMSSSRFPGKVLEFIGGLTSIEFMVNRVRRARLVDQVVVATSTDISDDTLVTHLTRVGIPSFRGDLHDVLGRYVHAAAVYPADEYVRLTGDCPLIDPLVVDSVISLRRNHNADYSSNIDPPTYPDGLDCECFTKAILMRANTEAKLALEREHVTPWMRNSKADITRVNQRAPCDASMLRLTVDYPEDLTAVRRVVELLGEDTAFDYFDIMRLLASNIEIVNANSHLQRESLSKTTGNR